MLRDYLTAQELVKATENYNRLLKLPKMPTLRAYFFIIYFYFFMEQYGDKPALEFLKTLRDVSPEEIRAKINHYLGDTHEQRMEGSLSNSPIGSSHWYSTLLSQIIHTAEFLKNEDINSVSPEILKKWGAKSFENALQLRDNYDKIPFDNY